MDKVQATLNETLFALALNKFIQNQLLAKANFINYLISIDVPSELILEQNSNSVINFIEVYYNFEVLERSKYLLNQYQIAANAATLN